MDFTTVIMVSVGILMRSLSMFIEASVVVIVLKLGGVTLYGYGLCGWVHNSRPSTRLVLDTLSLWQLVKYEDLHSRKWLWNCLQNGDHFENDCRFANNSKTNFVNEDLRILIQVFLNCVPMIRIGSNNNGNTRYWPPGSLHTLGAGGHI